MRAASAAFLPSGFSHAMPFSFAPFLITSTMRSMFWTRAKFGPQIQMQSIAASATIASIELNALASPTFSERASAAASSALARVGL